jgi:hypothetical protein
MRIRTGADAGCLLIPVMPTAFAVLRSGAAMFTDTIWPTT